MSKLAKTVTDLPPGTKEGETKMVNGPGGVTAFQWSKGKWEQIGQVVGASGKETYDGKGKREAVFLILRVKS